MTRYVVRLINETTGLVVQVVSFDVTSGYSHSKGWGIHVGGKNPSWPNVDLCKLPRNDRLGDLQHSPHKPTLGLPDTS